MDNNFKLNLLKIEKFFLLDIKIKKILFKLKPPLKDESISDEYLFKYVDNMYDELKYIYSEFKDTFNNFNLFMSEDKLDELYKKWYNNLSKCGYDRDKLETYYLNNIADMSEELINSVKRNLIGYSMFKNVNACLEKVNTINELLHVVHSYIVNNEYLYKELNVISKKNNNYNYPITLYGEPGEISKMIFDSFSNEINCGWTDIVSLEKNNKIYMMIRDLGHATTIEFDISGNDIMVSYFIPKICNAEKVNKLRGVNKVSIDSDAGCSTTGKFISSVDEIGNDLNNFLSMIPTDDDILFDNFEFNNIKVR